MEQCKCVLCWLQRGSEPRWADQLERLRAGPSVHLSPPSLCPAAGLSGASVVVPVGLARSAVGGRGGEDAEGLL